MVEWSTGRRSIRVSLATELVWPPRFDAKASAVVRVTSASTCVMVTALCIAAGLGGQARNGMWLFVLWSCAAITAVCGLIWASSPILLAGTNAIRFVALSDVVIALGLSALDRPVMSLVGSNLFVIVSTFSCLYLPTVWFAAHVLFTTSFVVIPLVVVETPLPISTALALVMTLWNVAALPLVVRSLWTVTQVNAERAYRDPLTGLLNRSGLNREFRDMTAARTRNQRCAAMVIDLDRFKAINDRFGHTVGDGVINAAATHLRDHFGHSGAVARIGGEEFAVILVGPPAAAERAVDGLTTSIPESEFPAVTMSAGAVWCGIRTVDGDPLTAALAAADRAMYDAKQSGGNRCVSRLSSGPDRTMVHES